MFHNLLYPQFCHTASHEQYVSNRRCDRSYRKVHNHHDTKVDRAHSKALYDWKEDRCEDQKCRRHIHKCSHDQKENIEDQQDHILLEIPRTSLLIAAGSPVKDITNDNTEDAPMISITIVVITAASTNSFGISLSLIVL